MVVPHRKRGWWVVLLLALLVGCDSSSRRTERLEAGAKAVIDPIGGAKTVVLDTAIPGEATGFSAFVLLEAGTTVEIEADDQTLPPANEAGRRRVKVFVWDGPDKGQVGWLTREDLWPSR